ncbi:hypothetical protein [Flagellimonas sp.]|uniref:hypothetical protein n=1 Tax=Flagellimonas sp. TaxID=2058762 RepID=UPI003BB16F95
MLDKWNRTGKIKAVIVFIICFYSIFISISISKDIERYTEHSLAVSTIAFVFPLLFIPIVVKLGSLFGRKFERPSWNKKIRFLKPGASLILFQFGGYIILFQSLVKILVVGIIHQKIYFLGFPDLFAGTGLLIGVWLATTIISK